MRVPTDRAIVDNQVCSISINNNNSSGGSSSIDGKDGSDDGLSKRQRIDRDNSKDNGKDGGDEKDDSGYEFIQKSDVIDPTTTTSTTITNATTTTNNNATTNSKKEEEVETFIPFSYCLDTFLQPEVIDIYHPAMNCNTSCAKTLRFKTFPKYLMMKIARYYVR